jgi:hypothetical protein
VGALQRERAQGRVNHTEGGHQRWPVERGGSLGKSAGGGERMSMDGEGASDGLGDGCESLGLEVESDLGLEDSEELMRHYTTLNEVIKVWSQTLLRNQAYPHRTPANNQKSSRRYTSRTEIPEPFHSILTGRDKSFEGTSHQSVAVT